MKGHTKNVFPTKSLSNLGKKIKTRIFMSKTPSNQEKRKMFVFCSIPILDKKLDFLFYISNFLLKSNKKYHFGHEQKQNYTEKFISKFSNTQDLDKFFNL